MALHNVHFNAILTINFTYSNYLCMLVGTHLTRRQNEVKQTNKQSNDDVHRMMGQQKKKKEAKCQRKYKGKNKGKQIEAVKE